MQVLLGDLTIEQFGILIGKLAGVIISFSLVCWLVSALIHGILDGWLFRKGALYYGSFRFLNVKFKALKSCDTVENFISIQKEIITAVKILQYQRIIPKFLCVRILDRLDDIYVFELEKFLKED